MRPTFLSKTRSVCEERGHINVKGISHPVATYQVVDFYRQCW